MMVAGTTAEIIKLSPLMRSLLDSGTPYELWNTAQHVDGLRATLDDLGLPQPDEHFLDPRTQSPLVRSSQVPGWMLRIGFHTLRHRRRLRRTLHAGGRPLVVVHGDTFTTVLGALVGRFLGAPVAHVEAGMRSGDLRNPMPEEINRRVVARLARLHFAPTRREVDNLRRERAKGLVVDTGANTAIDALRMMLGAEHPPIDLPDEFGLVTLHRFEMLRNSAVFAETLRVLKESSPLPLVMPAGDTERRRVEELGLSALFDDRFRLVAKQPYPRFLPILARASFVVTDSGGLQQECGILGRPAAIQRDATESHQGIGENLVLTQLDPDRLRDFLARWEDHRRPSQLDAFHPTEVIMGSLRSEGYVGAEVR
ncbi:UDP-N-acetylglucosamine 2-epimerase [Nocardioides sp. YIM 152315]|uniref:UDP-N-acetylglucosamine 2-epimerase n=1 Tax=Nocardioides sp. YIM 152315 TaxID=3031760 RepID=UPI0023DB3F4B|nr:UDP-N-acetylglucosamine 2-epimerase [Nocardioides sp. YIM 152315]MDF1605223.1 UDP-N-acetylglucosamine 2-epimerase [Nocardioides sp. YIM 152315]